MPRYYRKAARRKRFSGKDYAKLHIQEAETFYNEVGESAELIKKYFFNLSKSELTRVLNRYESEYGSSARGYAESAISSWRTANVRMSGMIAKRLFAIIPPLMPPDDKYKLTEILWRRYAPGSKKYLYIGLDVEPEEAYKLVEDYFFHKATLHKIPPQLEQRFDWLSENDVLAKQDLLNHFMESQKSLGFEKLRLELPLLRKNVEADAAGHILHLSHTVQVGNHDLHVILDRRRTGASFSDSPAPLMRKPAPAPLFLGAAAILVILFWIFSRSGQSTQSAGATDNNGTGRTYAAASDSGRLSPVGERESSGSDGAAPPGIAKATDAAPPSSVQRKEPSHVQVASLATVAPPQERRLSSSVPLPLLAAKHYLQRPRGSEPKPIQAPARGDPGCQASYITEVSDRGAVVSTANGSFDVSSASIMQYEAAQWSTGDNIRICRSGVSASIENPGHFAKVQATLRADGFRTASLHCSATKIADVRDGGATVQTADGYIFNVSIAGVMRYEAGQWSTGDAVDVCISNLRDGAAAASIQSPAHFAKVQASIAAMVTPHLVHCRPSTVATVSNSGSTIKLSSGSTYDVSTTGVMRFEAQQWSTGDSVTVCEISSAPGQVAASISNAGHFAKIQALKIP